MSARLLATMSLFSLTTVVLSSEGPISTRESAKAGTLRTMKLMAQAPGVIDFIGSPAKPLAVGDRVAKGQILVQLEDVRARMDRLAKRVDPQNLKAAQFLAEESEARMITARKLFKLGAIGRADVDAAMLMYHKYRDEAAALQKALELAQAGPKEGPTPLERAELAVEMHRLRSPFNGVVRAIYKTRGEGVKSSEAILLVEEVRE
jgi:multidrug efflux pump subunit AcrA (membrane-fusion protein)